MSKPLPLERLVLDGAEGVVVFRDPMDQPDDAGYYEPYARRITIQGRMKPDEAFEVLVHELLHYVWRRRNLNQTLRAVQKDVAAGNLDEVEELFVAQIGDEVCDFLRANKDTIKPLGKVWETILTRAIDGSQPQKSSLISAKNSRAHPRRKASRRRSWTGSRASSGRRSNG